MKSFEVGGRRGGGTNVWTTSIVSYKLVLSVFALGNLGNYLTCEILQQAFLTVLQKKIQNFKEIVLE